MELLEETSEDGLFGWLGVVDGWLVAIVEQVAGSNQAIAAIVAGPTGNQDG